MNFIKRLFTRKPKRSEWMEGLLWAEDLYSSGLPPPALWVSLHSWLNRSYPFEKGVSDYLHHAFNTLENKQ